MKLTLLKWHPYSNRQLDMRSTLSAYKTASDGYRTYNHINFNKGDGIQITQTINYLPTESDDFEADYLIVSSNDVPSDNAVSNDVISRWYVLESNWNRQKQRILTLRRDIIADTWADVKGDPFYCEKGIVPATDDFIFTPEPLSFNRSLSSIQLLKPESQTHLSGYAVAYVSSNYKGGTYTQEQVLTYPTYDDLPVALRTMFAGQTNVQSKYDEVTIYVSGANDKLGYCPDGNYRMFKCVVHPISKTAPSVTLMVDDEPFDAPNPYGSMLNIESKVCMPYQNPNAILYLTQACTALTGNFPSNATLVHNTVEQPLTPEQASFNNMIYLIQDVSDPHHGGWKVTETYFSYATAYYKQIQYPEAEPQGNIDIINLMKANSGSALFDVTSGSIPERHSIYYRYAKGYYTTNASSYSVGEYTITLPNNLITTRPYNAFYFEYNANNYELAKLLPRDIADNLYDIQLIAYKPESTKATTTQIGSRLVTLNWIETFVTNYTCPVNYNPGTGPNNIKYHGMTDTMRVVAPDSSASWDFTPVKAGITSNFNITVSQDLEPYATQYFITTTLGRMYGGNPQYNSQGLRYQLSCSIPHATSQWASYKTNNVSYQNVFNRQIENAETMHGYDMAEGGLSAITSAAGTAVAGSLVNPALGIGGGIASGVAGIIDQFLAEGKFQESLDYTKDQYAFNMTNIQSRPNTYSGGSVFQPNNSIFAKIELYEATTDEYDAWSKYETYNAWTLGKITTLNTMKTNATTYSAISTFVKGYLCRCSLHEDAHFTNELNNELQRGVYIVNTI